MAKVTITIEDKEEGMNCKFDFDPPLKKGVEHTEAQQLGIIIGDFLTQSSDGEISEVNGKQI